MPRRHRLQEAGLLHHVVCRGNDRQPIFSSVLDFQKYLDLLAQAAQLYPVKIYNYVLMNNHIHLLIEPVAEGNLSKFMEYVSKNYAKYFNKQYQRVGHVFQGRFKSFLVQSERYFFTCSRYIDLNPVTAEMVSQARDYQWSGYNTLAHGVGGMLKIDFHPVYDALGSSVGERQIAYRALVNNIQGDELDLLNKRSYVLGDGEFKKRFAG